MRKKYHFVTTAKMEEQIAGLCEKNNWSVTGVINHILRIMNPVLDLLFLFKEELSDLSYEKFGAESEIKFLIDIKLYRKLKNIHGTMQTFSVAVIVRKLINLYFKYMDKIGIKKLMNILRNGGKRIENIITKKKHWLKKDYGVHKYDGDFYRVHQKSFFSENFTLLGFQFVT